MRRKWQAETELERRLRAAGVPLEVGEDDRGSDFLPSNGLFITQAGECSVLELDPCGAGYILDLCIVPNFPWPFEISALALDLPWQDSFLHWIPDPLETLAKDRMYWLPTREPRGYSRDEVINHHIGSGKRFSRGRSLKGLLLGFGAFMPESVLHGGEVPASVRISDQFGKHYSFGLCLRATRMSAARRAELQQKRAARRPLFACPDPEKPTNADSRRAGPKCEPSS